MPNPVLYILTVLFQTIRFSISTRFQCQKAVLFKTIQFRIRIFICLHSVKCPDNSTLNHSVYHTRILLFQTIQFTIRTHFISFWLIDRTHSVATTPGQSGPGSDGCEGVLRIHQSLCITGNSPSDCLVSYPGHPSMYSTAPNDWAIHRVKCKNSFISSNSVEHKYAV